MSTVDISRMGNLLNMSNVFSLYMDQLCKDADRTAANRLSQIRRDVLKLINQLAVADINFIMCDLVERTSDYEVLTRRDIVRALDRATPFHLLSTAALIEDEGWGEGLIYLLHPVKGRYKGKELLTRFHFVDNTDNN